MFGFIMYIVYDYFTLICIEARLATLQVSPSSFPSVVY